MSAGHGWDIGTEKVTDACGLVEERLERIEYPEA